MCRKWNNIRYTQSSFIELSSFSNSEITFFNSFFVSKLSQSIIKLVFAIPSNIISRHFIAFFLLKPYRLPKINSRNYNYRLIFDRTQYINRFSIPSSKLKYYFSMNYRKVFISTFANYPSTLNELFTSLK